jgi:hypothetical protein
MTLCGCHTNRIPSNLPVLSKLAILSLCSYHDIIANYLSFTFAYPLITRLLLLLSIQRHTSAAAPLYNLGAPWIIS